ncbi:uncharacterized protein EHS24_001075 [Apiotrichum porosum]|uniref:Ribosomal protein L17 n=1 Tax=Apiotrichum porosum TaxID=105984 RepID=A0A427YBN0_9TREE|nr:uncharacterized protein EHS24_001075 [Apiotrichum porosum]RSH88530.1 hypothetical protein EHS24_001075 [Apiotrichum porosum]
MKHGLKLRKLGRTSSHRYALLRNLVSALLHHEMIKTTLPKAKEAARMAEKIITLGKRKTSPAVRSAQAFLMPPHHYGESSTPLVQPVPRPAAAIEGRTFDDVDAETFVPPTSLLPKLFSTLAERYEDRPGGYTRIHRFGRRPGDNAPVAIVTLVDGPKDLKFEMTARAVARETAEFDQVDLETVALRPNTKRAVEQVLKYRSEEDKGAWNERIGEHKANLINEGLALGHRRQAPPADACRAWTSPHTGLGLARGTLGRRSPAVAPKPRFAAEEEGADINTVDK